MLLIITARHREQWKSLLSRNCKEIASEKEKAGKKFLS